MPKHVKWGPLEVFQHRQNRQKNEGWTLWRYLRKKSHKAEKNLHKKFWSWRDSNPCHSACQTSKKP